MTGRILLGAAMLGAVVGVFLWSWFVVTDLLFSMALMFYSLAGGVQP